MVDFRKWFPVLAVVAVMLASAIPASAQTPAGQAFNCQANAGATPTLRAEGLTELVGDVVLNCTGGIPAGQPGGPVGVPSVNFAIFLNTNVTSRLTNSNWSEALMIIDEPAPADQRVCTGLPCGVDPNPGNQSGVIYDAPAPSVVPNVFQGQPNGVNSIAWLGVPVDAPGTTLTRVIRITNVRSNANQLGVSSTLIPSQVVMLISATASTVIPINNPQQIVGFVVPGMSFSVRNALNTGTLGTGGTSFLQCTNFNFALAGDPSAGFSVPGGLSFHARFTEGFASSFKRRNVLTTPDAPTAITDQDTLTVAYNTETGFFNSDIGGNNANNVRSAGLADHGTRLMVRYETIPAGVQLFAATSVSQGALVLRLISTDANGAGGYQAISQTSNAGGGLAPLTISGGIASAVYEVLASDPLRNESVDIPMAIAFRSNTGANLPALGTATVSGSFAPLSTVTTMSTGAPIPRFADTSVDRTAFVINACATNLLYVFVANTDGFDTGLVISNTSQDPFGTPGQTGACRINYYGTTTGGGAAPAAVTTAAVPAGAQLIWTLSSGGGVVGGASTAGLATPGFRGYIIAQCAFQYAHGFAFISDIGARALAEGYLALVLDEGIISRTNNASEVLGH